MTYWQQYWPLTLCSHEVFSVPSGSDLIRIPKWTASVHTGPVFLWAVCLHGTFLLLSVFGGSGGNKNRSSTTSDCLHVQKGRVVNRSPAHLYKTVYTLLLLLFFSFWDQHPKNVADLYRRVGKRLQIKEKETKMRYGTDCIRPKSSVYTIETKRYGSNKKRYLTVWIVVSHAAVSVSSRKAPAQEMAAYIRTVGEEHCVTRQKRLRGRQVWMLPVSFLKKSIAGHILSSKIGSVRAVFFSFLSTV